MVNPYVGQIQLFAFGFAPVGYLLCNGAILPIAQNMPLFSLIGCTYGGNGVTTFALPDLTGALPLKVTSGYMCYYISQQGLYPVRG